MDLVTLGGLTIDGPRLDGISGQHIEQEFHPGRMTPRLFLSRLSAGTPVSLFLGQA